MQWLECSIFTYVIAHLSFGSVLDRYRGFPVIFCTSELKNVIIVAVEYIRI